ncbi:MAG TPA: hydantoinase/oxoprolinase family protein [Baekduia sp.]|nr:hydantoinase/oxoprolinase family protein [Baekduia sp.]
MSAQMDEPAGARVGIDVGGTFTDAALIDAEGRLFIAKLPTRIDDRAAGFAQGVSEVTERAGAPASEIAFLAHGTTVATNAIVENTLAKTALITNEGFGDLLEIGTMQRPDSFDISVKKPAPIVARDNVFEVSARTGPDGAELSPLDEAEVRDIAARLREREIEAVSVCLLFSFLSSEHERRIAAILREQLDGVPVSISSRVAPELREYVRAVTTTLNASLLPLVGSYVDRLVDSARDFGRDLPLHLMQSNGGLATPDVVADLPVALAASGPAAGVVGAARLASLDDENDLVSLDVGGTTADIALITGGQASTRFQATIGHWPVTLPQVDVISVGAGGGSLARVDAAGGLVVGPESAGARPGPAAYGVGGEHATLTDASVVIGVLAKGRSLPGDLRLDGDRARAVVEQDVGIPLGLDPETAANAIIRVAVTNMANAVRLVSVGRGQDPRELSLVAVGGAGPMYACAIAEELGMSRVVVPATPGVTAALGLLVSEVRHDLRRTWIRETTTIIPKELDVLLGDLRSEAEILLERSRRLDGTVSFSVDMRYRRQAYNLTISCPQPAVDAAWIEEVERRFAEEHERVYHYTPSLTTKEIVTVRAVGSAPALPAGTQPTTARPAEPERRELWDDGWIEVPAYDRRSLSEPADGPCLIEQEDTTTFVPAGWRAEPRPSGNLIIEQVS